MRVKMSKQPPPAPTTSAIGPCPTVIQIVGRPGIGSLPSTIAPPDHPQGWDEGVSNSLGPSGLLPLAGTTAKATHHLVCLAKDEDLTTPTDPSGSVPPVDLSSMPSALQGCKYTDGGQSPPYLSVAHGWLFWV